MTRRRKLVTASAVVLPAAVVLAVVVAWFATRPQPTRATFEKVAVGMSRAEVRATVGGPLSQDVWAWEESGTVYAVLASFDGEGRDAKLVSVERVEGRRAETVRKVFQPMRTPPSFFDRIRSWLGF